MHASGVVEESGYYSKIIIGDKTVRNSDLEDTVTHDPYFTMYFKFFNIPGILN
jgi:hypothetical protein